MYTFLPLCCWNTFQLKCSQGSPLGCGGSHMSAVVLRGPHSWVSHSIAARQSTFSNLPGKNWSAPGSLREMLFKDSGTRLRRLKSTKAAQVAHRRQRNMEGGRACKRGIFNHVFVSCHHWAYPGWNGGAQRRIWGSTVVFHACPLS